MRLTLRTMLAHLDGILEPEDAQDIGKKIEESQYATSLFHRVRDVMRRLRLSAPSVSEREPGLDANTVAEYLDNTLPGDRVPDFEKVCLESDVYLAEVASCHQVLAAVLGEPAEIEPESRQRMYQLPQVAAQAAAESRGEVPAATGADGNGAGDAALHKARPKPTVPEYLREPPKRRRLLTTLTLLVLAGCFAGAVLLALGQFEPGTPLGNLVRTGRWNAEVTAARDASNPESAPDETVPDKGKTAADKAAAAGGADKTATASQPGKEKTKAAETPQPTATVAGAKAAPVAPGKEPPPGAEGPEAAPTPLAKIDAKGPPKPGTPPPASNEPLLDALASTPDHRDSKVAGPAGSEPGKPAPEAVAAAERVGRFNSEDQVLLAFDPQAGFWQRVPAKEPLVSGQRLLALPTYRAEISLNSAITLQMLGGTQVQLLAGSPQAPAGLEVAFGRLVLMPLAQGGPQVRLVVEGRSGVLTLADAETIAAVEVVRYHAPGVNPESQPPRAAIDLYVSHGAALWQEKGAAEPVRIVAPARLPLDEQTPREPQPLESKALPNWIVLESLGPLEQRASNTVAQSLQGGRSASLSLTEIEETYHRQKEVVRLVWRCLDYLDQFDPMVAALNNPADKADWLDYFEQLRQAAARGPETAAAIRQSLEKKFGQEAPAAYRMFWGYSDKDLQNGADAKLVQLLEHETLAFRVLGYLNLKDLTGLGLFYHPEYTTAKRQQPVKAWKQRREAGEIRIKSPEEKSPAVTEPAPLEPPPPPAPGL